MDLSKLTRPAILCQCSRCSSSLAALENEWAKLSNSYSLAAGWLSVELHRISISPERKQIPQSSDLTLIRGRIIQEIACKLCQQKLGVICMLDNGPNVFWKLSKVSFREIVTMRTVEPLFKDGLLENLLSPPSRDRQDRTPSQPGALVPAGPADIDRYGTSVEQQIQHQGLSIDHISSSVSNLHDTMFELKQAFTALRIELNGPTRSLNDVACATSSDFNMITTVLKELKSKSEEIERLKLELEAMKLRNRYMEEQSSKSASMFPPAMEEVIPEVATPGLLQRSRKRPYPDYFQTGRNKPIADSFEDDDLDGDGDSMADFSIADSTSMPPVKIPLKEPDAYHQTLDNPVSHSPQLRIEVGRHSTPQASNGAGDMITNTQPQAIIKRRRLSMSAERPPSSAGSQKRKPGRPRKSVGQSAKPDIAAIQTPKPTPLGEQNGNAAGSAQRESSMPTPNDQQNTIEVRSSRSRPLRSRSRPPSPTRKSQPSGEVEGGSVNSTIDKDQADAPSSNIESGKENGSNGVHEGTTEVLEKRKARTTARDIMAKLAMQREEAMDTEESR